MNWLVALSIALLVIIPILLKLLYRHRARPGKVAYQKRATLLSPEERVLHGVLTQAVGEEFAVFGHVRAGDVLYPGRSSARSDRHPEFEELADRPFAFLLCHKADLTVACAIELDERSPGMRKRSPLDAMLRAACESAGLPVVRIATSPFYEVSEVREAILQAVRRESFPLTETHGRKEPRISSMEGIDFSR